MGLYSGLGNMVDLLDDFNFAIRENLNVGLTFFSEKDGMYVNRICAPLDYAPSSKYKDKTPRFHFWDFTRKHNLALLPENISGLQVLNETTYLPLGVYRKSLL